MNEATVVPTAEPKPKVAPLHAVFTLWSQSSERRYFGSTMLDPRARLLLFKNTKKAAAVNAWVKERGLDGPGRVRMRVLVVAFDAQNAARIVADLVEDARAAGNPLINEKAGSGGKGARHSAETRARMSATHKRSDVVERHRANIAANPHLVAQIHTPEARAKVGAALRGRRHSHLHAAVKLSPQRVRFILTSAEGSRKLSKRYGISRSLVRRIRAGQRWPGLRAGLVARGMLPALPAPPSSGGEVA